MARALLWIVFSGPLGLGIALYLIDEISYGELLSWSGVATVWLLLFTLTVSALWRRFPCRPVIRAMRQRRRDFGLITFACALLHVLAYLERKAEPERIFAEAQRPDLLIGWLAFAGLAILALTSNDFSVRWLGRRWRALHMTVYGAAALTFAHWVMSAYDPTAGWLCAGVFAVLLAFRTRRGARPQAVS
ncbi:MAG: ferric reductase-like transmembrane domain-containing protein [Pseudomonadales bacterium]|nr:ferric reductase-like transmembrane domain-containing protein [Pseudomonadales bacterium]